LWRNATNPKILAVQNYFNLSEIKRNETKKGTRLGAPFFCLY
jgi:hypothetical protein